MDDRTLSLGCVIVTSIRVTKDLSQHVGRFSEARPTWYRGIRDVLLVWLEVREVPK